MFTSGPRGEQDGRRTLDRLGRNGHISGAIGTAGDGQGTPVRPDRRPTLISRAITGKTSRGSTLLFPGVLDGGVAQLVRAAES